MNQVTDDWHKQPFTQFVLTDEKSCPDSHPKAVWTRLWHGMRNGCDCIGIYSQNIEPSERDTITPDRACNRNQTKAGCN